MQHLPYYAEAEEALLSCLLQDPVEVGSAIRATFKEENPFFDPQNATLYSCWTSLPDRDNHETVLIDVCDKLHLSNPEAGWIERCQYIYNKSVTSTLYEKHLHWVRETYMRRAGIGILSHAEQLLYGNQGKSLDIFQEAMEGLRKASEVATSLQEVSMDDVWQQCLAESQAPSENWTTGYYHLDKKFGYQAPGRLNLIVARPSVGKSMMLGNILRRVAKEGMPCGFFSAEMKLKGQLMRQWSAESGIHEQHIKNVLGGVETNGVRHTFTQEQQYLIEQAVRRINALPVWWDETFQIDINELEARTKQWKVQHDIKYLFIDHMQKVKGGRGYKESDQIADVVSRVAKLSGDLDLCVWAGAQINRSGAGGEVGTNESIKGSGQFEEDADMVWRIDRPIEYTEEQQARIQKGESVGMKLECTKNRNGATGWHTMRVYLPVQDITDDRVLDEDVPK